MPRNNPVTKNIDKLASKLNLPSNTVQLFYEKALKEITQTAKVKRFVEVFALKVTEENLQTLSSGGCHGNA